MKEGRVVERIGKKLTGGTERKVAVKHSMEKRGSSAGKEGQPEEISVSSGEG